jgi:hypothetical protein
MTLGLLGGDGPHNRSGSGDELRVSFYKEGSAAMQMTSPCDLSMARS